MNLHMTANPLLDMSGLPRFADVRAEHIAPALDVLLADAAAAVALAETAEPDWDACVRTLDDAMERLGRAWSMVSHLQSVLNPPDIRDACNQNMGRISAFYSSVGQSQKLFANYKAIAASAAYGSYSAPRRRVIDTSVRDFRLSGAELTDSEKCRLAEMQQELAMLSTRFANNVVDATDAFVMYVEDEAELDGIPADVLRAARIAADNDGRVGWKLTLQAPCLGPVMMLAKSRALRQALVLSAITRASDLGPQERDNTALINRTLALRAEVAEVLGFPNFGEYSLATKMARNTGEVLSFLNELATRALPFAKRDRAELEDFARTELALNVVEPWDLSFVGTKLMQSRYSFSQQEVKAYFTLPKVLDGLFDLVDALYGVKISEDRAPVWHPDVRFYRLTDRDGALMGQFYLDPYAREGKRGGAWMDPCRTRRDLSVGAQTPIVHLVCNFGRGVDDKPATLTHHEIITLFHEMGHGLHHLLSEVGEMRVSGIHGVEWDAVELPSQFMENFCWEWERLRIMSGHVETGAELPRELFDRMLAARHFQSGMQMMRNLEVSLFDMELHTSFQAGENVLELLKQIRAKVSVNPALESDRFPHQFSHIFAGGYAAGYYSYKWAEVLSADAYSVFEMAPDRVAETGARFRREVLGPGGSRPAIDNFRSFRGQDPALDALLRYSGLAAA